MIFRKKNNNCCGEAAGGILYIFLCKRTASLLFFIQEADIWKKWACDMKACLMMQKNSFFLALFVFVCFGF